MSSPFTSVYPTGGIPTDGIDIPASAVLLVVYLGLAIIHGYFFFVKSKRTFVPQAMIMGFCIARVISMSLRIAWTVDVTSKNIAIASNIFLNAGVLLLYIVNMLLAHRFILTIFPQLPRKKSAPFNLVTFVYVGSAIPLLILVVVPGVQLFLTSKPSTIHTDRDILRFAQCYLTVFVSMTVIATIASWTIYFTASKKASGLHAGHVTLRAGILFGAGSLLVWIQAVKILQTFYTATPETAASPPWFLRRPILYSGFFLPELLVVIIYAVASIRLRFQMPKAEEQLETASNSSDAEMLTPEMGYKVENEGVQA
jgi:hypothetical protein